MSIQNVILQIILPLLGLAASMGFIRLVRGPTLPDRVVALDFLALMTIGGSAVYAVATGHRSFLYAAVVLSLISFIGTVAYAFFVRLEKSE